mmetsp:Transcript_51488/g.124324  ORF Transcript_51488/g.124324 Transcript_51488/m.124324 type:complete len:173 (-) Transcript_51488:1678-2196(-)
MFRSPVSRLAFRAARAQPVNVVTKATARQQPTARRSGGAPHQRMMMSTSSPGPLEADSGGLATHAYHTLNLGLAVATPLYFILPIENGIFGKIFGVALAGSMSAHSWVGLNYVATDYVPKVSKALLPPARIAIAGMCGITFVGLSIMSVASPGGIKGCVKGLWNPAPKDEKK